MRPVSVGVFPVACCGFCRMLPLHVLYVIVACCLHGDIQYFPDNEPNPSSNTKRYDLQMYSTAALQPELLQ